MAQFSRLRVLTTMAETGLIPIMYHKNVDVVMRAVSGCVEGGSRLFEYTNRGDGAFQIFEELVKRCRDKFPDLILGIGSINDPHTAAQFIATGADFVVSPTWNPELARLCNSFKIAHLPGCGSLTEIAQAESYGCEFIKLFPAGCLGGPGFIKAIRGPRPWTNIMPTGGVSPEEDNVKGWIKSGAACVGMGSQLYDSKKLESGEDEGLPSRVASVLGWIQEARGKNWTY